MKIPMTAKLQKNPKMPEGDTIWRAARALQRGLGGKTVTGFETALPKLERVNHDTPITGRTVESVTSSGKWMEMRFSGNLILLTHMLMSGSWHIYRPGERWQRSRYQMRIVISTSDLLAVAFNVPVAEFHDEISLARRRGYKDLGPELLQKDFDAAAAIASLASRPEMEIGSALLNQSLIAGLGNVFKSETCFVSRVNPFRKIGSLSAVELENLASTAKRLIEMNVTDVSGDQIVTYTGFRRTTGRTDESARLWVYGRTGEPCRVCGNAILSQKQGTEARRSFWCPICQKT
jgi:endonuclease-8